jgi:hypothetical protein
MFVLGLKFNPVVGNGLLFRFSLTVLLKDFGSIQILW